MEAHVANETLAELRTKVLEKLESANYTNPCLEAAERALTIAPGDPFFLWATLTQLRWFFHDRSHSKFVKPEAWISREDGLKKLAARIAESLDVLARGDDGSSDRRMLLRLANLLGGLRKVVDRPTPEKLAEARAHCDVYERTQGGEFDPFEEKIALGNFFRQLRARIRAWETVEKSERQAEDFLSSPSSLEKTIGCLSGHSIRSSHSTPSRAGPCRKSRSGRSLAQSPNLASVRSSPAT